MQRAPTYIPNYTWKVDGTYMSLDNTYDRPSDKNVKPAVEHFLNPDNAVQSFMAKAHIPKDK